MSLTSASCRLLAAHFFRGALARSVDASAVVVMGGGPARQAPSSETSGENRSSIIIGIIALCWVLATIVVTLRIYTRKVLLKQIGTDDYFAAASLVSLIPFFTSVNLLLYYSCEVRIANSQTLSGVGLLTRHWRSTQSVTCAPKT